ncbi:MAG: electron transport complex subunit E [Ruminococcus sp.]|nr:electron transport complex subunit E [Ruminococcus sp.]
MNNRCSILDGFITGNAVLSGFMVISPIIVCGNTIMNSLALIYAFSAITFLSVTIGSFIPKKLSFGFKTIIHAVIASLVYIPVKMAAEEFFPGVIERIGIYFMLVAVNSIIVVQSQTKFHNMTKGKMTVSLICHILGFDVVMLVISAVRELLAYGTFCGRIVDADMFISGLGMPFGGFILLGLACGLYRSIVPSVKNDDIAGGGSNVSDF